MRDAQTGIKAIEFKGEKARGKEEGSNLLEGRRYALEVGMILRRHLKQLTEEQGVFAEVIMRVMRRMGEGERKEEDGQGSEGGSPISRP